MLNIKKQRHKVRTQNTDTRTQTDFFCGPGFLFCALLSRICRPVALIGRASDSKSEGWGFESLLACHFAIVKL